MTLTRHPFTKLSFRLRAALAAAFAAAALALSGAHATAQPTFSQTDTLDVAPDAMVTVPVADAFDNAGTNPRYTSANYSNTAVYYSLAGMSLTSGGYFGTLVVQAKTTEELNAMSPAPDSPITLTAEVSMTNDEGDTASGTITFETHFTKPGTALVAPTFSQADAISAPPGTLFTVYADSVFNNAGTNPRFTEKTVSEACNTYCDLVQLSGNPGAEHLNVQVKSNADLSAISPQPANPFTFTVDVTMTNDEGQTATGTISFQTSWTFVPGPGRFIEQD